MGSFFSNMHIRRGEKVSLERVIRCIEDMMAEQDYEPTTSAQESEMTVVVADSISSDWFSVYSKLLQFEDDREHAKLALPLSAALSTDVLTIGCFDSDYLYMNLINAEENLDAWAAVGSAPCQEDCRNNEFNAWKTKVQSFSKFAESFNGEDVFADDVLSQMEECLCLPQALSTAQSDDFDQSETDESIIHLYFRMKQVSLQTQKPCLVLQRNPMVPCFLEQRSTISVLNTGGASRGLSIFFVGSYVEKDEITFSDVQFVSCAENGAVIGREPFELEKVKLPDGRWAYFHHAAECLLPEKVDERLPDVRKEALRNKRCISVQFTPHGNKRKLLDIEVFFVPDENRDGQAGWNVWHRFGSKEAYIREYNGRFISFAHAPLKAEDFD